MDDMVGGRKFYSNEIPPSPCDRHCKGTRWDRCADTNRECKAYKEYLSSPSGKYSRGNVNRKPGRY